MLNLRERKYAFKAKKVNYYRLKIYDIIYILALNITLIIMKKILLVLFFIISLFSVKSQTTVIDSIFVGGQYRSYRLYVPAIYTGTTARPLILNLHGYTSNAQQQQLCS